MESIAWFVPDPPMPLRSPASPPTTPFLVDLPLPPSPQPVPAFLGSLSPDCLPLVGSDTRYYQLVEEERLVSFHPQLPPTQVWSYRDINVAPGAFPFAVGPTFRERIGQGPRRRHRGSAPERPPRQPRGVRGPPHERPLPRRPRPPPIRMASRPPSSAPGNRSITAIRSGIPASPRGVRIRQSGHRRCGTTTT